MPLALPPLCRCVLPLAQGGRLCGPARPRRPSDGRHTPSKRPLQGQRIAGNDDQVKILRLVRLPCLLGLSGLLLTCVARPEHESRGMRKVRMVEMNSDVPSAMYTARQAGQSLGLDTELVDSGNEVSATFATPETLSWSLSNSQFLTVLTCNSALKPLKSLRFVLRLRSLRRTSSQAHF